MSKSDKFCRKEVVKDFSAKHGKFADFSFGANSITGSRLSQEDRFVCLPCPEFTRTWSFFAIYDGHGGEEVAEYLKRNLHHHILAKLEEFGDIKTALSEGFKACDVSLKDLTPEEYSTIRSTTAKRFMAEVRNEVYKEMLRIQTEMQSLKSDEEKSDQETKGNKKRGSKAAASSISPSARKFKKLTLPDLDEMEPVEDKSPQVGFCCGSTATVVVFTDEIIYVANVGDSRCIASVNGKVRSLSRDHRPLQKNERERIIQSGHSISRGRIDGGLNMSRAFGDFALKIENIGENRNAVIVEPTITAIEINPELDFIIVASDGIWNNMENDDVINFVSEKIDLPQHELSAEIFEHILSQSKKQTGQDNMSIIIIKNELSDKNTKKVKSEETEVKETEVKETEVKETEVKETEVKETKVKETKVKETEVKETKEMDSEKMAEKKTETKQPVVKKRESQKPEPKRSKRLKK